MSKKIEILKNQHLTGLNIEIIIQCFYGQC